MSEKIIKVKELRKWAKRIEHKENGIMPKDLLSFITENSVEIKKCYHGAGIEIDMAMEEIATMYDLDMEDDVECFYIVKKKG